MYVNQLELACGFYNIETLDFCVALFWTKFILYPTKLVLLIYCILYIFVLQNKFDFILFELVLNWKSRIGLSYLVNNPCSRYSV